LLYELSSKATWFVVIAPHKKPEVGLVKASCSPGAELTGIDQGWMGLD
jgi:hypothetical protein